MANKAPKIKAESREHLGSRYARRIRRQGKLPTVVYGHKQEPTHVSVDHDELVDLLHIGSHILDIKIDSGKSETCLIKDVQYDYLGTDIIHLDLVRVSMTDKVTVTVPIEIKGAEKSPGAKTTHAIVENPLSDIEVTCLATSIPEKITVDISEMELDESILVENLTLPDGVETDHAPDSVVVSVHMSKAALAEEDEAEEAEGEEDASAEPEVITERKEESTEE